MSGWLVTAVNLGGSAVLAFAGSWIGSYYASRRATQEVEREEKAAGEGATLGSPGS